jgi:D-cysteine desulfhydrase
MRDRVLFDKIKGLNKLILPLDLVQRPSPISNIEKLAELWSLDSLHIKRDDLLSPIYGGSKSRMIEYFLGQAKAQGKTSVASMGPFISHQLLGIGAYAKVLGMECRGTLVTQPDNDEIERYMELYAKADIKTIRCNKYYHVPLAYIKTRWGKKNSFWVPPGGNDSLGVLALVDAAFEFAAQIKKGEVPMPQDIVVPTGTCATAAGLYLGFSMLNLPIRIVAVRVVPMLWTSSKKLLRTAKKGLKVLREAGFEDEVKWGELLWVNDHADPGYGLSNKLADAAMADVENHGDFRTETTYTGKTLGIFKNETLKGRKVVFWNTYSAVDPNYKVQNDGKDGEKL